MELFDRKELDIQGFLVRTVSLSDRFDKQDVFDFVDELDSEPSNSLSQSSWSGSTCSLNSEHSNLSELSDPSSIQINPCNVCLVNPKSVLLRPCNHLNICDSCWDHIESEVKRKNNEARRDAERYVDVIYEEIKPKCPTCNQVVNESIRNVYIYT